MNLNGINNRLTRLENKDHKQSKQVKLLAASDNSWIVVNDMTEHASAAAALKHIHSHYLTQKVIADETRAKLEHLKDDQLQKLVDMTGPEAAAQECRPVSKITAADKDWAYHLVKDLSQPLAKAAANYPQIEFEETVFPSKEQQGILDKLFKLQHQPAMSRKGRK